MLRASLGKVVNTAYIIQFKLLMRNLTDESGKVISWDGEVTTISTAVDFQVILGDLKELSV
jgi:hypothetical protein